MSSRNLAAMSSMPSQQSGKLECSGTDTESVTEDPIVPQIIVPKPECDLDNVSEAKSELS